MVDLDYTAIGLRIKMHRLRQNMTQQTLAEKAGLTAQYISNIETGNTKVGFPTIIAISNVLCVSVDAFLEDVLINVKSVLCSDLSELLQDCNSYETRILVDILKEAKRAIRSSVELRDKLGPDK